MAKLVTRKSENCKPAIFISSVKALESGVLRGEPALARRVHNQQNLAAEVGEMLFMAIEQRGRKFVDSLLFHREKRRRLRMP